MAEAFDEAAFRTAVDMWERDPKRATTHRILTGARPVLRMLDDARRDRNGFVEEIRDLNDQLEQTRRELARERRHRALMRDNYDTEIDRLNGNVDALIKRLGETEAKRDRQGDEVQPVRRATTEVRKEIRYVLSEMALDHGHDDIVSVHADVVAAALAELFAKRTETVR